MAKPKMLPIGSISTGTLRAEDVVPALADALRDVAPRHKLVKEADALTDEDYDLKCEEVTELWDELLYALQQYAPPYCYVGAIEGDGADIGCWFDSDRFREAQREGEIHELGNHACACKCAPQTEAIGSAGFKGSARKLLGPNVQYLASISDHGNVTLFTLGGREVLSVC